MADVDPEVWTEPRDQEVLVKRDALHTHVQAIYRAAGVSEEHALTMADLPVETDVRGVHSHGTRAAPGYIKRLQAGHTNPPWLLIMPTLPQGLRGFWRGCEASLTGTSGAYLVVVGSVISVSELPWE